MELTKGEKNVTHLTRVAALGEQMNWCDGWSVRELPKVEALRDDGICRWGLCELLGVI